MSQKSEQNFWKRHGKEFILLKSCRLFAYNFKNMSYFPEHILLIASATVTLIHPLIARIYQEKDVGMRLMPQSILFTFRPELILC